jgi:fermentation-respiration switch protein FrsA (DUF1100 family)
MLIVRAAFALVAAAAFLLVLVRLLEPRLAFFPSRGETTSPADFGLAFEPRTVETADRERLRAWLIPQPEPRALVVYFHGNGGHLSMWAPIVCAIAEHGYSVLAFDYRGYGVSSGRPTEAGLYRDVDAVLEHARATMTAPGRVIYWGRSLGVSMAAYAATSHPPAGLILESGFPDTRSLFRTSPAMAFLARFSTYRFPAAEYLRAVSVPVLVLHGDADRVIPYEQGRALYEQIEGPKTFFTIAGGDHNDVAPPDEFGYWDAIREFADRLHR